MAEVDNAREAKALMSEYLESWFVHKDNSDMGQCLGE